jgi:S1-C subfamily serine protease
MSKAAHNPISRAHGAVMGLLALLLIVIPAAADQPATRPLLDELNRETRNLFKQVSPSIVRVQLPLPSDVTLSPNDPLNKWANQLDAQTLANIADFERRSPGSSITAAEIQPSAAPSSTQPVERQHIIVLRVDRFSPNSVGIVVDENNHLLIPRYVDKDALPNAIPVSLADGKWATATFVASDRQADLTLLQLTSKTLAKPAVISPEPPDSGALVLVMSLNPAANRLAVWEGWEPDVSALVNTDGTIAGFTKGGHFLDAAACLPAVGELIEHGYVRRAQLGVWIQPVALDDIQRQRDPALGASPALRVVQVVPGTAAQRAGLMQNDLILSLAGESVGDAPSFAAAIANRRGQTAITILRNGQEHVVDVDLRVQ